jgi:hypothetical protein
MRIIIICGDPDCGEEYPTDTKDRTWECPHCGRVRENQYYPFLTAQLMNARIHSDEADWREHHDQLLSTAKGRLVDLRDHIGFLRKDLGRLRVQLPEEDRAKLPNLDALTSAPEFLDGWTPEADPDDMVAWRDLHDKLLEGAREEILALEDAVNTMETEITDIKSKLNLA